MRLSTYICAKIAYNDLYPLQVMVVSTK